MFSTFRKFEIPLFLLGSVSFIIFLFLRSIEKGTFGIDYETFYLQTSAILKNLDLKEIKGSMLGLGLLPLSPPFSSVLLLPLGFFEFNTSKLIFGITNVLFFYFVLFLVRNKIENRKTFLLLALLSLPILETILVGQLGILLLVFLTIFFISIDQNDGLASLALAFAVSIKITPIVILLPLFFYKRRLFYLTILLIVIVQSITMFVVGSEYFFYYYWNLLPSTANQLGCQLFNQSFLSGFKCSMEMFGVVIDRKFYSGLSFLLFLIISFPIFKYRQKVRELDFFVINSFVLMLFLSLINSITWPNHLTYLILLYVFFQKEVSGDSFFGKFLVSSNFLAILFYNKQYFGNGFLDFWANKILGLIVFVFLIRLLFIRNKHTVPM